NGYPLAETAKAARTRPSLFRLAVFQLARRSHAHVEREIFFIIVAVVNFALPGEIALPSCAVIVRRRHTRGFLRLNQPRLGDMRKIARTQLSQAEMLRLFDVALRVQRHHLGAWIELNVV